jgi:hypothetical protein
MTFIDRHPGELKTVVGPVLHGEAVAGGPGIIYSGSGGTWNCSLYAASLEDHFLNLKAATIPLTAFWPTSELRLRAPSCLAASAREMSRPALGRQFEKAAHS